MGKIYGDSKKAIAYLGRATDIDVYAVRLLHDIAECWKEYDWQDGNYRSPASIGLPPRVAPR